MTNTFSYLLSFLMLFCGSAAAQSVFRVMSYNVENFFDTEDNPELSDDEFLPDGNRRWNMKRYLHKMYQTSRVIAAAGEWYTPALVALCEVENDTVVTHLLNRSPLKHQHYRHVMTHGNDSRGINSALLYQRDMFAYIGHTEHNVSFTNNRHKKTRNILHAWGRVITGDTLDVFVCHFPSRYGGEKESEPYRRDANRVLRRLCDSLFLVRQTPQIIIMGDFNATAESEGIADVLAALKMDGTMDARQLYNLPATTEGSIKGTHKFQGEWSMIDHIIVSGNLLSPTSAMRFRDGSCRVFSPAFILTRDKVYGELRPLRFYHGFKYEGGFSDHLPVLADFETHHPF